MKTSTHLLLSKKAKPSVTQAGLFTRHFMYKGIIGVFALMLCAFPAIAQNTAYGTSALFYNTTGYANTAIGEDALLWNTTGSFNTANGVYALSSNTTGWYNTATGAQALYSNTTGQSNTAHGRQALRNNTTGYYNTAAGIRALSSNTTGYYNTATGANALLSNTTGYYNTASGYQAMSKNTTGGNNIATGVNALYNNTTGSYNTVNGFNALYSNTTGYENTANGSGALFSNTTGFYNIANGSGALYSNTTGGMNTASGVNALKYNTTSHHNTAYGWGALYANIGGSANTAIGLSALSANLTGDYNVANGILALISNKGGSYNTALGFSADVSTPNLTNATAIGNGAVADASDKVRIGNTSVTSIGGEVGWTTFPSDRRYKTNIKENVAGLAFVNSLRPITYTVDVAALDEYFNKGRKQPDVRDEKGNTIKHPEDRKGDAAIAKAAEKASKIVYNGFIAQEVEEAANKLNFTFSGVDKPQSKEGLYGLRYDNFVVPLVKAVQELSKQNDELQKQLYELKALITNPQSKVSALTSSNVTLADASLEQNVPNPFNNTTTISYTLPQRFTNAQILIVDKSGRMIKQVNVSGTGKGTFSVDAATLSSGAYNYSLIISEKSISTKQMILTK